jgi:hypothetical protein
MPFKVQDEVLIIPFPDTGEVTAVLQNQSYECVRDATQIDNRRGLHHETSLRLIPATVRQEREGFVRIIKAKARNDIEVQHHVVRHYHGGVGRSMGGRIWE